MYTHYEAVVYSTQSKLYPRYKGGHANIWGLPVRKYQIREFVMINPLIFLVSQSANPKSTNLKGEKAMFLLQIHIGLPLIFFFTYVSICSLDYEMPCNCKAKSRFQF
jgi:hypothetical protein